VRCLVTAGPTWEPLDRVRRLTNFSSGSLGGELANHLVGAGHEVTLLLGEAATWRSPLAAVQTCWFSSTASLEALCRQFATPREVAFFHAAAVSDFTGGRAFERAADGSLSPLAAGKLSTRSGPLLVELAPTPKLLPQLRGWFPRGRIFGWKYEVDGGRAEALAAAERQLREARNDACVVNGPAYGSGFGLLHPPAPLTHLATRTELFGHLSQLVAG